MKNQKGFSLIELLIVVVIIGIIAAIAIPNLIAARRAANEGSAQSVSRTLHSAQVTFSATKGNGNYAGSTGGKFTGGLSDLYAAGLIDSVLSSGAKSGYNFITKATDAVANTSPATFTVGAQPSVTTAGVTQTGTRSFCVATDGIVRAENDAAKIAAAKITADGQCLDTTFPNVIQ